MHVIRIIGDRGLGLLEIAAALEHSYRERARPGPYRSAVLDHHVYTPTDLALWAGVPAHALLNLIVLTAHGDMRARWAAIEHLVPEDACPIDIQVSSTRP